MSDSMRNPLLLVIALAGCAGGYFWLRSGPGAAPATTPEVAPTDPGVAAAVPAPATANTPPAQPAGPPPAPSKGKAIYPDGSEHPALNGVEEPIKVAWPGQVPFSPIVGQFVDGDGLQWYRHEDGSQSTTKMTWRKDLGRNAAMTLVANPTKATPVLMEEPDGKTRLIPGPGDDKKKN
ncbi:MAG: hypothetical protein IPK26_29490 [Planctomycetes bacterium]|nr:hypothetical protein [Planctomycetota bacterium]